MPNRLSLPPRRGKRSGNCFNQVILSTSPPRQRGSANCNRDSSSTTTWNGSLTESCRHVGVASKLLLHRDTCKVRNYDVRYDPCSTEFQKPSIYPSPASPSAAFHRRSVASRTC